MLASLFSLLFILGQASDHAGHAEKPSSVAVVRGSFVSVQVNVSDSGGNIKGDAANTPSIAVDPSDRKRIVIGWRQFDAVNSNFRQAGWAYSRDGGHNWKPKAVLQPGTFRESPVVQADADGSFYYGIRGSGSGELSKSIDGGHTWLDSIPVPLALAFDIGLDRTRGVGRGHIYVVSEEGFTRSTDGGKTFCSPVDVLKRATDARVAAGPDGTVYVAGLVSRAFRVAKSSNAKNKGVAPSFDSSAFVKLGGTPLSNMGPNPGGTLGRLQLAVDHSASRSRGNVYLLCSVHPISPDPVDVMFARSTDGGSTWSKPVRINDDPETNGAWQWFGAMSVAPNGRIDVLWNDSRGDPTHRLSELYYSYSTDGGATWSTNVRVSPPFDPHIGWPNENKIGNGYDIHSENAAACIAYAATFNREQDVYFLRIPHPQQQ